MPGPEQGLAGVGHQRRLALQDVDQLVLARMGVAQRGHGAGRQRGQVDAEIGQPEQIAERPLHAARHPRGERLGVVRAALARRCLGGHDRLGFVEPVDLVLDAGALDSAAVSLHPGRLVKGQATHDKVSGGQAPRDQRGSAAGGLGEVRTAPSVSSGTLGGLVGGGERDAPEVDAPLARPDPATGREKDRSLTRPRTACCGLAAAACGGQPVLIGLCCAVHAPIAVSERFGRVVLLRRS